MISPVLQRLTDDAVTAVTASRAKTFDAAVRRFTDILQTVPDCPPGEMSDEGFARMNGLAEQVILEIERHLDEDDADPERRELLAESVDEIRRGLEEAFRWRRHCLRT